MATLRKAFRLPRVDWPLLGKELLEQASRRQTYIVRVTYAVVLFGAFVFYYIRNLGAEPVLALGRGRSPFLFLVTAQLLTIFLFLPPMMAGAIAQEKERDTLGLLFLTDLTPWELVLQKYIGRLIPMLTLLFLSLPLLGVTYSLGGVSSTMLCYSAITLFLTCLAVGALSLECSAHQATTFQALVRSWGLCVVFVTCCWTGPLQLGLLTPAAFAPISTASAPQYFLIFPIVFTAIGYLVPTALFLVRAKENLEPRAFIQPRNPFAQQFKRLDQYRKDVRKLMRAILRKRDQEAYVLADQVVRSQLGAFDDRQEWSLGKFLLAKMQVPNLIAVGIILGFVVFIIIFFNMLMDPKSAALFVFVGGIWIVAVLTLPIQSANAVASERINGRLSAILTTPLTAAEILNEWLTPVRRWIQFIARPLIVLIVVEAGIKFYIQDPGSQRWIAVTVYLGISLLTVWIYPRLIQWSCLWIGLRVKNQIRAMMTAFLAVVAWCILPLPICSYLINTGIMREQWGSVLAFLSPVSVIGIAEMLGLPKADVGVSSLLVVMAVIHLALAGALMWTVRRICLTKADEYLGRV